MRATPSKRISERVRVARHSSLNVRVEKPLPFGDRLTLYQFVMHNGLRVLILPDSSAPVVSYQTWFRVGSRHEKPGKTGLAHLFEHLMFNETKNIPQGQFDRTLEAAGGETNAATWVDWTFYYENVPSAKLELVMQLESERMGNLVLRDPQVRSEKEVVANERRYRVEDDVEGSVSELLYATAFTKHPYHWPTIGWMKDIEAFNTQDCHSFYETYYAPNNATLVVAGDVDVLDTLKLLKKYYGKLEAARIPSELSVREPVQSGEKVLTVYKETPTEKLQIGFRGPAFGHPDHAALSVVSEILFGGRSSRLYRRLVSDGELATEARGSVTPFRDPGLFEIWVSMREKKASELALKVIDEQLRIIANTLVSDEELDKVKNRLELGFLQGLETASGKAEQIGFYDIVLCDASAVFSRLEQYRRVSRHDIRRVAQAYFKNSERTVIHVLPEGYRKHPKAKRLRKHEKARA